MRMSNDAPYVNSAVTAFNFHDFVTQENIDPPTEYAKKHWPAKAKKEGRVAFSSALRDDPACADVLREILRELDDHASQ